jgi:hypothetical protein
MLTKEQASELKRIIKQGADAQELLYRSFQGLTNFSDAEVKAKCDEATKALKDFIKNTTEK